MQKLYFNRETLEQLWLDEEQHRNLVKDLLEKGWISDPPLEHMHNPRANDFKLVHIDDAKFWEDKGYYRGPSTVYHPTEGTKIVPREQAQKLLNGGGWYDNPGKFPGNWMAKPKLTLPKEAA
jgi:hypothetical protein